VRLRQKVLLLGALYLAQGLPFGFFTQALPVLLRDQGYSLKAISLSGFLFLPWALKFAWAPVVDHYGTRRQWLLTLQLAAVAGAAVLAWIDLDGSLWPVLVAMLAFSLISATQDIATDGLTVNLLGPRERGLGNGLQVGAYRLGMVLGGGLLLWVFARYGWTLMFGVMTALLALTVLPVLRLPQTPHNGGNAPSWRAVSALWWQRLRRPGVVGFIALICLYKAGDSIGASLVGPFMHDSGMSKVQIALLKGTLGSTFTVAGAAAGAWLAWRLGRRQALLWSGVLQAASLLPYALAATGINVTPMIATACIAEHLFGGMATVALFTLMMDASDPQHAGTDYTVLACALVVTQGLAAFVGASIGDAAGYPALFTSGIVVAVVGCAALIRGIDRGIAPRGVHVSWQRAQPASVA
jgi:MFS family permease